MYVVYVCLYVGMFTYVKVPAGARGMRHQDIPTLLTSGCEPLNVIDGNQVGSSAWVVHTLCQ